MRNRDMPAGAYQGQYVGDGSDVGAPGLTKREAAAIAAMQGMLAYDDSLSPEFVAAASVGYSDALFDELEKGKGERAGEKEGGET